MTQWYDLYLQGEYQATIFVPSREELAEFTRRYGEALESEGARAPYPEEIRYVQRSTFHGDYLATLDSTGGYLDSYSPVEEVSRGSGDAFLVDSEGGEI